MLCVFRPTVKPSQPRRPACGGDTASSCGSRRSCRRTPVWCKSPDEAVSRRVYNPKVTSRQRRFDSATSPLNLNQLSSDFTPCSIKKDLFGNAVKVNELLFFKVINSVRGSVVVSTAASHRMTPGLGSIPLGSGLCGVCVFFLPQSRDVHSVGLTGRPKLPTGVSVCVCVGPVTGCTSTHSDWLLFVNSCFLSDDIQN